MLPFRDSGGRCSASATLWARKKQRLRRSVALQDPVQRTRRTKRMETIKVAIIVATKDRPEILEETLLSIRRQTWPAIHVYVSVSSPEDVPSGNLADGITVVVGPVGGSAQRNTAIRRVP